MMTPVNAMVPIRKAGFFRFAEKAMSFHLSPTVLVRVAGYSAYFTELSASLQDEVISRTEEKFH